MVEESSPSQAEPINRLGIAEMLAEALREAAVLVAVFSPLEMTFSDKPTTPLWVLEMLALAVALLVTGVLLERKRRR